MTEGEWLVSDNVTSMIQFIQPMGIHLEPLLGLWVESCRRGIGRPESLRPIRIMESVFVWCDQVTDLEGWKFSRLSMLERANFLRDIVGNPFHSTLIDPKIKPLNKCLTVWRSIWKSQEVLSIFQRCWFERDWDGMFVLADALQDAGCNEERIISHLLDKQTTHVKGCWVLRLILEVYNH